MKDDFGNRMKLFEGIEAGRRLIPLLPICIRLDGKCFSSFTRNMKRPFDETMTDMMIETARYMVEETNARVGYVQSDEISLILYSDSMNSQVYFDGRIQKLVSILAAKTTAKFMSLVLERMPNKFNELPVFDCRVWNVPTKSEAVNTILWREQDASKNSISMLAQAYFSHTELNGKSGEQKQEMLFSKFGINWNDLPAKFKRGTYVQRQKKNRRLTPEELQELPPKHNARKNPDMVFERTEVVVVDLPPMSTITNRVEVVFDGKDPITTKKD